MPQNLLALASIGADTEDARVMIEDKCCFRECANEIDKLRKLGVAEPGVEGKSERRKTGEALAKIRLPEQPCSRKMQRAPNRGTGVTHRECRMPRKRPPAAAICACSTSRQAIRAAIRHGGNAGGAFRFADRPQRFRPGC